MQILVHTVQPTAGGGVSASLGKRAEHHLTQFDTHDHCADLKPGCLPEDPQGTLFRAFLSFSKQKRRNTSHEYFNIDLDIMWDTIRDDIPSLIEQLEQIVPPEEDNQ